MKFTQAHHTPKKTIEYMSTPAPKCPSDSAWCNPLAACATATTITRSKKSSSGVEARCSSSGERGPSGATQGRCR